MWAAQEWSIWRALWEANGHQWTSFDWHDDDDYDILCLVWNWKLDVLNGLQVPTSELVGIVDKI